LEVVVVTSLEVMLVVAATIRKENERV
jgi:hypothetical protein